MLSYVPLGALNIVGIQTHPEIVFDGVHERSVKPEPVLDNKEVHDLHNTASRLFLVFVAQPLLH